MDTPSRRIFTLKRGDTTYDLVIHQVNITNLKRMFKVNYSDPYRGGGAPFDLKLGFFQDFPYCKKVSADHVQVLSFKPQSN